MGTKIMKGREHYDSAYCKRIKEMWEEKMNNRMMNRLFPKETKLRKHGQCVWCEKVINMEDFRDELSKREFRISGICQRCIDKFFDGEIEVTDKLKKEMLK